MGASTTLGSAGLIATEYLLRYYAKGGRLIGSDNIPRLAMPLAAEVLADYLHQLSITKISTINGGVARSDNLSKVIWQCLSLI